MATRLSKAEMPSHFPKAHLDFLNASCEPASTFPSQSQHHRPSPAALSVKMHHNSIRTALARTFQIPLRPLSTNQITSRILPLSRSTLSFTSPFSTSISLQKKGGGKRPEKRISTSALAHSTQ